MDVNREALKVAGRSLKGVTTRRGIPALEGWHVTYDGGWVAELTATDLETTVTVKVAASGSPFGGLVPGKLLASIADKSKGDTLTITSDGGGKVKVGNVRLRELAMGDFPNVTAPVIEALTDRPTFTAKLAELTSAVEDVAGAVSNDQARPVLTGMLAVVGVQGITLVGTDSYRLHVAEVSSRTLNGPARALFDPKLILAECKRRRTAQRKDGYAAVEVYIGESGSVTARFDNGTIITTRGIEGEFPQWERLIPDEGSGSTMRFEHDDLADAVKLAADLARDTAPFKLALNGSVIVRSSSPDLGDAEVEVESGSFDGDEMEAGFNPAYFLAALKSTRAERFEVRDGLKPGVFRGENRIALVMPVRVAA